MRISKILTQLAYSFLFVVLSAAGHAADEMVTISGTIQGAPLPQGSSVSAVPLAGSGSSYFGQRPGNSMNFTVSVPKGQYALTVTPGNYRTPEGTFVSFTHFYSVVGVDARNGAVSNVVIPAPVTGAPKLGDDPPVASLISVGTPSASGIASITGAAGAAKPVTLVTVINSYTGQYNQAVSEADGSFTTRLWAPPGSQIAVIQDPTGSTRSFGKTLGAGTVVRVPIAGESTGAFALMAPINDAGEKDPALIAAQGLKDGGQLWLGGTLSSQTWTAGQSGQLGGTAVLYSREIDTTNLGQVVLTADILLTRVLDGSGNLEHFNPEAMSHVLTPSGFPIERANSNDAILLGNVSFGTLTKTSDRTATSNWSINYTLPANLPAGTYQLAFSLKTFNSSVPSTKLFTEDVFPNLFQFDRYFSHQTAAPLIRVGASQPGKLTWVLGMNDLSQGSRGIVANEDRNRFAIAPHIITNSEKIILPRNHATSGAALRYSLEPFVPMIAASNKGTLSVPTLNFRFPSGQLNVRVETPLGVTQNLGSAPFRQAFIQEKSSLRGWPLSPNSNKPSQFYALTTLDERFETTFQDYGLHKITLSGSIDDIFGNSYSAQGTYDLYIANPLDLETGVFPSTPFEVGDVFAPTLTVNPGVPADVEIRVRQYPNSSTAAMKETVITGKANDYGYFQPTSGTPIVFSDPGEYRVDYTATYTDGDGVLWMASASWGSVIETPASSLITHGRRGLSAGANNQQWFFLEGLNLTNPHVFFPYQNGDVIWMEDPEYDPRNVAHQNILTMQDPNNLIVPTLRDRVAKMYYDAYGGLGFNFSSRAATGEIPLVSTTASGLSPALMPTAADVHWSYFYSGAARPGVRVREMVSEDDTKNGYWRFDDTYNYQLGNGLLGDEPNDFKFQFGGAVYRAPDRNFYYYGAYSSLFVLLPANDTVGMRVTPPFEGASGGPNGGPLMMLKGRPIEMFYHPLGVRAGSVLEKGDIAAFSGQIGPTLDAKVTLTITKPGGATVTINGQANKVGYFYFPNTNFVTDEVGRYKVQVAVLFDGRTSSGPVEAPFPQGDVLGSDDGSYFFYVVNPDAAPLGFSLAESSFLTRPTSSNNAVPVFNVPILQPNDLTNVAVHETTYMPGFILQQQTLTGLTYQYDAMTLNADYPNLDVHDSEGRAGVETVTMSFLLSGTNANGVTEYRAGQVLLQGEQVFAPVHQSDRQETQLSGVITTDRSPSTAVFRASASSDSGLTTRTAFTAGDWVSINATIVPQAADVGKSGELFVVVRSLVNGVHTWTYLGQDGVFHPWPTVSIAQLDSAVVVPSLSTEIPIRVVEGNFAAGSHFVYVGYMRGDGTGPLHYNSTAHRIEVAP